MGSTWGLLRDNISITSRKLSGDNLGDTQGILRDNLETTWGLLSDYLGTFAPISDHWPLNDLSWIVERTSALWAAHGHVFFSSPSGNQGATAISKGTARQSLVILGDLLLKKKWFLSGIAQITFWTPRVHFILKFQNEPKVCLNYLFRSLVYLQNCEYSNWF